MDGKKKTRGPFKTLKRVKVHPNILENIRQGVLFIQSLMAVWSKVRQSVGIGTPLATIWTI